MKKSLSERIAAKAVKTEDSNASINAKKNRAAFIVLRQEIEQAMQDEWPIKTIWETLKEEGKIPFGYQAFRRYVNRLIVEKKLLEHAGVATLESSYKEKSDTKNHTKLVKTDNIKGFKFESSPNKEDLI
ncbi:MAG: TraK family protein [Gammaproteobacteria bacterium]